MKKLARMLMVACAALLFVAVNLSDLNGQRRGGGGGRGGGGFRGGGGGGRGGGFSARSSARPSVSSRPSQSFDRGSRPSSRPSVGSGSFGDRPNRDRPSRGDINRGDNIVNRGDINIDRDIDIDDGGWWNHDHDGCCVHHPIAAAAALGTAAAVGYNAAIGTTYTTLPESCFETVVNGISYWQCGTSWYQPQFYGTDTTYLVVAPPS